MVVLVVGDVWVANIGCVARNLHVVFRQGVGYFLTLILNTTIALVHLKTMKLERTKIAAQVNVAVGKKVVMSAISTIHAAVVSKDNCLLQKKILQGTHTEKKRNWNYILELYDLFVLSKLYTKNST